MHSEALMSLIKAPWDTALEMLCILVLKSCWSFLSKHIISDLFWDNEVEILVAPQSQFSTWLLNISGPNFVNLSVWFCFWHSLRPPMSHLLGFREVNSICCHPYIIQMWGVVDFCANAIERTVECNGESERNVGAPNLHWECRTFWLHLGFQSPLPLSSNSDKWWNLISILKITGQIGCGTLAPKLWCLKWPWLFC